MTSLRKDRFGAGEWGRQGDYHHSGLGWVSEPTVAHSAAPGTKGSRNQNRQAEQMQIPSTSSLALGLGGQQANKQTASKCVPVPWSDPAAVATPALAKQLL